MDFEQKYDVFISYSRKDYVDENRNEIPGNIVSKVKDLLDDMNVSYWFDEDGIYGGDEFAPLIARAIKNSSIFLFVSSENSNASEWTSNEIATANAFKKKIIPFRIDDSAYNDSVIMYIAKLDYIDYTAGKEKAITRLRSGIESYLKHIAERELLAEKLKQKEEIQTNLKSQTEDFTAIEEVTGTTGKLFKRLAQWFTNPNGKVRSPLISTIIRIIIILGYIAAFSFFTYSITNNWISGFIDWISLIITLLIVIACILLNNTLKWKRLPFYLLVLLMVCLLPLLFDEAVAFEGARHKVFFFMLPFIVAIILLLCTKYHGKTFFEQTEPVVDNLLDKNLLRSFALTSLLLAVIGFGVYLYILDSSNSNYDEPTVVEEEVICDTVAPSEDGATDIVIPDLVTRD